MTVVFPLGETLLLCAIILILPEVKKNFLFPIVGIVLVGWFIFNAVDHVNQYGYFMTGALVLLGGAFGISAFYSIMRK